MATTTNYGWETPDDTDLVKDGAAAIRTLGSSIDTTTKNLNPETTLGDISYRSATSNVNTRLPIGSNGQYLTISGGVPAWGSAAGQTFSGCLIYPSTTRNNYLSANTTTTITFDSELFDTDGFHSTSTNTNRITVPSGKAGYYAVSGCVMTTTNTDANSLGIYKNGTRFFSHDYTGNGGNEAVFVNGMLNLSVGDYVDLRFYSGSNAKTLYGNSDTGDYTVNLFVQYLGA
jgi:hypothetical protein